MSRSWPRVASPSPGRSTLITSAPNQASNWVQVGPDCTWVKSRMRTPSRALVMRKTPESGIGLGGRSRGLEFGHAALERAFLLEAGGFVADDGGDAGHLAVGAGEQGDGECNRQRAAVLVQGGHTQQRGAVARLAGG